ncbi:hypothetical protein VNO77_43207 [Canavalia gladiata]|uniref:Uncharacterized protein n=1 Tax=Canavalia gladiata TaxID=3824 RepID=A0AAN9JUE0_CANGL
MSLMYGYFKIGNIYVSYLYRILNVYYGTLAWTQAYYAVTKTGPIIGMFVSPTTYFSLHLELGSLQENGYHKIGNKIEGIFDALFSILKILSSHKKKQKLYLGIKAKGPLPVKAASLHLILPFPFLQAYNYIQPKSICIGQSRRTISWSSAVTRKL